MPGAAARDVRELAQAVEKRAPAADTVGLDAHQFDVRGKNRGAGPGGRALMPLVMARAMISAATPAATPATEMAVTTPTTLAAAWL